jgi:hypothetical protein
LLPIPALPPFSSPPPRSIALVVWFLDLPGSGIAFSRRGEQPASNAIVIGIEVVRIGRIGVELGLRLLLRGEIVTVEILILVRPPRAADLRIP